MDKTGRGNPFSSQSKGLIIKVYKWLEENQFKNINICSPINTAAEILGITTRSIQRIKKEEEDNGLLQSPKKKRSRKCSENKTSVNTFDAEVIRRTIYDFHTVHKKVPSLKTLLPVIKSNSNFSGERSSLNILLKNIGFRWKKMGDSRSQLREKLDIVFKRIDYLKKIREYRQQRTSGRIFATTFYELKENTLKKMVLSMKFTKITSIYS